MQFVIKLHLATVRTIKSKKGIKMGYRDNVQAACDQLRIQNPIQEADLTIGLIKFTNSGHMVTIDPSDINRSGRLFFQVNVPQEPNHVRSFIEMDELKTLQNKAADFFAENWEDAEDKDRKMLIAFKHADIVSIDWK